MAKYDPLFRHLQGVAADEIDMSFDQIEGLVGPLPRSARSYPAWWANERAGSRHVQCRAWIDAGWETEDADLEAGVVRFCTRDRPDVR